MSQANVSKLMSKIRFKLTPKNNLRSPEGPQGRHNKIRKTVTALFKHERIELSYLIGNESRGYAERLISDAIKYGDCHKETMKMASYWILEKQLVHKLFKVLAPRYEKFPLSYTRMWKLPGTGPPKCILELRNNIYPPLGPDNRNHKNLIHNILLSEAKKVFEKEKALKILQNSEKTADMAYSAAIKESQQPDGVDNTENKVSLSSINSKLSELNIESETTKDSSSEESSTSTTDSLKTKSSVTEDSLGVTEMKNGPANQR